MRLELEHPEKQFYKPCRLCQYMKATDLESVYRTLRDEPAEQRITVPDDVRAGRGARDAADDRAGAIFTGNPRRVAGRLFDEGEELDALAAVVEPGASRFVPIEMPGPIAERDPQLPRRGLRREHQPLLFHIGDGQRALRDGDLRHVGIDGFECPIDAGERVVEELPVAFFIHHLQSPHRRVKAIQKSKPPRRTSMGTASPNL